MSLDQLVISLLDAEANIGLYKKELANELGLVPSDINDVWLESEYTNGVISQYLYISFDGRIPKEKLDDFNYAFIDGYNIVIEVGDRII